MAMIFCCCNSYECTKIAHKHQPFIMRYMIRSANIKT